MQTSVIYSLYIDSCSILYLQRTVMNVKKCSSIRPYSASFIFVWPSISVNRSLYTNIAVAWKYMYLVNLKKKPNFHELTARPLDKNASYNLLFKKKKIGFVRLFILNIFNYCCFKFHSQHIRRISFLAYLNTILKRFFSCVCQNPKIKFNGYSYTYT